MKMKLLGCKGCGSSIAEAFLTLTDVPYEREEINYDEDGPARDKLFALNPLGQVPTIVMPTGEIMTETLAVAHYVHSLKPELGLIVTGEGATKFLRWTTFIISSIYPTFTYGDSPEKWVSDPHGAAMLRESTDEQRKKLWRAVEKECVGPFFMGERACAIDYYFAAMVHWRPRKPWFEAECPKISASAKRVIDESPPLQKIWKENF